MMKFSIITVCRNSEKSIRKTFDAMLAQTFSDYEYWVVDGASTDGTVAILKEYEPRFQGKMRWISEPDGGIYAAMNKGIRLAKGEIIGIINSDDWYEPDALERIAQSCRECPDGDIYYGILKMYSADGRMRMIRWQSHELFPDETLMHPAVFARRSVYDRFGMFQEDFRIAGDYDWLLRVWRGGGVFVPVLYMIANFPLSGMSNRNPALTLREHRRAKFENGALPERYYRRKMLCLKMKDKLQKIIPRRGWNFLARYLDIFVE